MFCFRKEFGNNLLLHGGLSCKHGFLPSADIPGKDFRYIILHELMHYKRRDMFYKWLVQITVCLHWFNPLVHLMSREITKACEFSCDEAVLAKMGSYKI